jgi:hypothetical protein
VYYCFSVIVHIVDAPWWLLSLLLIQ